MHGDWDWGWGWVVGTLMMLLVWGTIIWGAIYLFRRTDDQRETAPRLPPHRDAESVLRDRFARGEIGRDEFTERLTELRRTERG